MITLSNFVKQADGYVLLLTMGKHDTVDMLPTAQRPFSPEYYPVSVDYGVPAAGSVAINYFTQENFVFVNGAWGKDSIPSVLETLDVDENGTYTPDEGVDGYDEVNVNVPQLDTSDATAIAGDILSPKTAYVNGEKVTGTIMTFSQPSITPDKQSHPMPKGYYHSFIINPIPDGYIIPTGSTTITANGTHDVTFFAEAVVNVPSKPADPVIGTVIGTATTIQVPNPEGEGTVDETQYQVEYATLKEIMDASDELIFKLSDSQYTRPLMGVYASSSTTYFEIIDYADRGGSTSRAINTSFIHVMNAPSGYNSTTFVNSIKDKVPYNIYTYDT